MSKSLLTQTLQTAQLEVELAQKQVAARRSELTKAEDQLVDAREARIRAEEALQQFELANDIQSTRDDLKDLEVVRFRATMTNALKKVADEPAIPYVRVGDLIG